METTILDLTQFAPFVLEILAGVLLGVLIWAGKKLANKLGVDADNEIRQYFTQAIQSSIAFGKEKAKEKLDSTDWSSVEVKNETLAKATEYLNKHVPDAIKKFKLSEEEVKELVLARLAQMEEESKLTK